MWDKLYEIIITTTLSVAVIIGLWSIIAFSAAVQRYGLISIIDKFMSL